ncbi:MAG TPA: agmatine deiminase family protein [Opitutales bacterium]|jgi:agmatine deiminase|nr:agmatine deiminase family protein [Opitutales bacterium]
MISSTPSPSPAELGFRLPPEWMPQAAVWLSWPSNTKLWPGRFERIPPFFANFAAALSQFVPVRINAAAAQHADIRRYLNEAKADFSVIQLFDHPVNDVWCRDHGPLFVRNPQTREVAVTDWKFNAWGGKFSPWNLDDAIPARIAGTLNMRRFAYDTILEGGAIEINGPGQLLTTEVVLLNSNRNPGITKDDYTRLLTAGLGVTEILWLPDGMPNDDTDGHVDNLTRFFRDDGIVTVVPQTDIHDEAAKILRHHRLMIDENFRTPSGGKFEIAELPVPHPPVYEGDRELPASYANYVVTNGAVLMPAYQRPTDDIAAHVLHECFPGHKVVPLDCTDVLLEGGALHCLSQQQPVGEV